MFYAQYIQSQKKGVLLLEVVMAMVILGVALVGIIEGFNTLFRGYSELEKNTVARQLMESRIQELEKQGYYRQGVEKGAYEQYWQFEWETETESTDLANVYRIRIKIHGPSVTKERIVYFKEAWIATQQ